MDKEILVDIRHADGRRFIQRLAQDGFPVDVALWVKTADEGLWYLYVGSPRVNEDRIGDAYGKGYESLERANTELSISEIKLVNSANPIVKQAVRLRDRHKIKGMLRIAARTFANLAVEEVEIYPKLEPEPERKHRHLIGLESPPPDFEPDPMTSGPNLPSGWDGDAWLRETAHANAYWLRAWNPTTGEYAIAQAGRYEDASRILVDKVKSGGDGKVEVKQKPKI